MDSKQLRPGQRVLFNGAFDSPTEGEIVEVSPDDKYVLIEEYVGFTVRLWIKSDEIISHLERKPGLIETILGFFRKG